MSVLQRSTRRPSTPAQVDALRAVLERARGNASEAARKLGVTDRTLRNWLARLPELAAEAATWRAAAGVSGPR